MTPPPSLRAAYVIVGGGSANATTIMIAERAAEMIRNPGLTAANPFPSGDAS